MTNVFDNCVLPRQNAGECARYLDKFLRASFDSYFPLRTKMLTSKRLSSPWLTPDIIKCIDKKHSWYKRMKLGQLTRESYKKYCKALRDLLRMDEEDYHVFKLYTLDRDKRRNWVTLNALLGRKTSSVSDFFVINNKEEGDPVVIANAFCDYFVSHPKNIHNSIPPAQLDYSNIIPYYECRFILYQCTPAKVYSAVCKLKKEGPKSDISVKFLKMCGMHLATVLCKFFNICFNEAVYPDDFKCSKISPIFKKGSRTHIETHRPISVLPNISKVFDSIINERLTSYFMSNGLLSASQFGFRENKNTELATLHLIDNSICVFLDFSACFDTISRNIIYSKLSKYGVQGSSLSFLKSYFQNRPQVVAYRGASSTVQKQEIGTIQGSKLGPRFFTFILMI